MTPLRKRMTEALCQRQYAKKTQQSYLYSCQCLAQYFGRSPEQLTVEDIQRYFNYLVQEKKLAAASCLVNLHAIRFLYMKVLGWPTFDVEFVLPKRARLIPELLTRKDVRQIFAQCTNRKHLMMMRTCYGCGLRVGELVAIKVRHIDGERHLLRVEQGKGKKDRNVVISDSLLIELRGYWKRYRPEPFLFSGGTPGKPLSCSTAQRVFNQLKEKAGIEKKGGIHSLRHAYATHQLEAGMPLHDLQNQLGHSDISTTLTYVHWVPNYKEHNRRGADLIGDLGERQ